MKIGITGHQNLGSSEDQQWIYDALLEQLRRLNATEAISCLARGSDQLFAKLALELKISLVVVLPSDNYERTFVSEDDLQLYEYLLRHATQTRKLPFAVPSEDAFFEAGKEVVKKSEVLFAVWNGLPSKGLGGTGDIVDFAKENNVSIIHINPLTKKVEEI